MLLLILLCCILLHTFGLDGDISNLQIGARVLLNFETGSGTPEDFYPKPRGKASTKVIHVRKISFSFDIKITEMDKSLFNARMIARGFVCTCIHDELRSIEVIEVTKNHL